MVAKVAPPVWGEAYVPTRNTALLRALTNLPAGRHKLVELGCGAGRYIRTIKRLRPEIEAHGADLSGEAIALAESYPEEVAYRVADVIALPYDDAEFDVALVFDVLEHLRRPELGVREIHRILRPGGLAHMLVPCEGQPLSLHWLLWKLNLAADLKERHGWHVQRFTRASAAALFRTEGFEILHTSYSMHPIGQIRDILTYLEREDWFRRWHLNGLPYRLLMRLLWPLAYVESSVFSGLPSGAVVAHLTCRRSDS